MDTDTRLFFLEELARQASDDSADAKQRSIVAITLSVIAIAVAVVAIFNH